MSTIDLKLPVLASTATDAQSLAVAEAEEKYMRQNLEISYLQSRNEENGGDDEDELDDLETQQDKKLIIMIGHAIKSEKQVRALDLTCRLNSLRAIAIVMQLAETAHQTQLVARMQMIHQAKTEAEEDENRERIEHLARSRLQSTRRAMSRDMEESSDEDMSDDEAPPKHATKHSSSADQKPDVDEPQSPKKPEQLSQDAGKKRVVANPFAKSRDIAPHTPEKKPQKMEDLVRKLQNSPAIKPSHSPMRKPRPSSGLLGQKRSADDSADAKSKKLKDSNLKSSSFFQPMLKG
jgi:hypothetical protein